MDRWVINIDLEGFSVLWSADDSVLMALSELVGAVFRIGRNCYPNSPERLFAHQVGDGFFIVSEFHESDLERAVTISAALMQHVASSGRYAKVAISEGRIADIKSCYPEEVINEAKNDLSLSIGMGRMSIFPVMGTAIINSVRVVASSPSGPLLSLENNKSTRIPSHIPFINVPDTKTISVNWIDMETCLLQEIQRKSQLKAPSRQKLKKTLFDYCNNNKLPKDWISNTKSYLLK